MGKEEKFEKELFEDSMWYHWRKLHNYFECLADEDAITDRTWTTMNDSLMKLKSLLPGEKD